ncbi:unnamed protein product [Prorocentrum cordatum]|uniref:Uncharacterized protein n=1 Tax=Prorocentrum cordatum TaxID=2364126 RepID=A0ABN9WBQ6_9DINO|nr:unnamed protein product [Polarella glacialis]
MAATMEYAAAQGLVDEEVLAPTSSVCSLASAGSRLSVSSVKRHESRGKERRLSWEGKVGGKDVKVRTKTFKMLDDPTDEELIVQLRLLHRWFPLMVDLDDGFDIDLNSLEGEVEFDTIEKVLRPR